jgi:dTDP-4-dehydrorhamnose reductase
MAGHKVVQHLSRRDLDVWFTLRGGRDEASLSPVPALRSERAIENVDALNTDLLRHTIEQLRPDILVNCLGVIKQRDEGENERLCMRLNAELPHLLANWLGKWNGRLIQVSTDCVFSGARGSYREEDIPDAQDVYGRSKALGEVRADNSLVLRTSYIGRELKHHRSLLDWFLSMRGKRVLGFRNNFWSGITTIEFARVVEHLVRSRLDLTGILHLAGERISKYDLLILIRNAYGLDVDLVPDDELRRDMSLDGSAFEERIGYRCPAIAAQVRELASDPTPYPVLPTAAD